MSLYLAVFGKPRYLGLVDIGDHITLDAGRWIVIDTLRGREMGLLGGTLSHEQEGKYRSACLDESSDEHTRGPEPMLQEVEFVEQAGESLIHEHAARRLDEEAVLVRSRQILRGHQFQMKLVDVEYTMDRKKLFFYFTSEQRVDFRAYVRDLAKEFRIRIEMRQIGVRDEAKTVRGVSPCGRPCCCSYWLHRFNPINIRMVKEQNLALNPTKISGICGRLMCCMFYEHSTYSELWKNLPSPGSKIKTAQGNYVMEGVDLHTETVRVGFPEGGEVTIPIAEFAGFKETIMRGEVWQKEEQKEQKNTGTDQRAALSRGLSKQPLSYKARRTSQQEEAKTETKAYEAADDPARHNKKLRPDKISIDEHIAGRVSEAQQHSQGPSQGQTLQTKIQQTKIPQGQVQQGQTHHAQIQQGQASQEQFRAERDASAKKPQHRRKSVQIDSRRQEGQGARDAAEHGAAPYRKPPEQRPRTEQDRPRTEQAPHKDAQDGTRTYSTHGSNAGDSNRRRLRYRDNTPRKERAANPSADAGKPGAAGKEDL